MGICEQIEDIDITRDESQKDREYESTCSDGCIVG